MSWDGFVAKAHTTESFMAEVEQARKCLRGKCGFMRQSCDGHQKVYMELEKSFSWLPLSSWNKVFPPEIVPADLGLSADTIYDEAGVPEQGVAFDKGSPFKTLSVRVQVGSCLNTQILEPQNQLRAGQGKDTLRWANKELLQKDWPKVLHGQAACSSVDLMQQRAREILEERARQPQPELQPAAAVPELPPPALEAANDADLDSEDSATEMPDPTTRLNALVELGAGGKGQKRKGKGSSRGRGKNTKVADVRRVSGARPSSSGASVVGGHGLGSTLGAESSVSRHRSRSPAGSRTGASTVASFREGHKDRLLNQQLKYMDAVDLVAIVSGKALGNEINHSRRIIEALEAREPGCAEAVELKTKVRLATLARELNVQNLASAPKAKREEGIKELWQHLPEVPAEWAKAIYLVLLKDTVSIANASLENAEGRKLLIDMLSLNGPPGCMGT